MEFQWWRLDLDVITDLEESLIWKLDELGIRNFSFKYSPDNAAQRKLQVWLPVNQFSEKDKDQLIDSLIPLGKVFGFENFSPSWIKVEDEDWNLSWKKQWRPDPIGKNLLVLPAWLEVPKQFSDRHVLKLDPGCAFGTGQHLTTRLCLEAIERNSLSGLRVVDLGCGSGILSIAALLLGANKVFAVDTDSLAVSATICNSKLNNLGKERISVHLGSLDILKLELAGDPVDLIMCNILAPVIETFAPNLHTITKPKAKLILSGLLVSQRPSLIGVFENFGWQIVSFTERDKWALVELFRA